MLEDLPLHDSPQDNPPPRPTEIFNIKMEDLKLEDELAMQYSKAKTLYAAIEFDDETPANQKAQVLNSLTAIITAVTKNRELLYNMARLKHIQDCLIATLRTLPEEAQNQFFTLYEAELATS